MRRFRARIIEFGALGFGVFAAGIVLGGAIVYGLHHKHWLGDAGTRKAAAFSEVPEPRAGDLAERFRPWLKLDSQEPWRPLNISRLFEERKDGAAAHKFCTRRSAHPSCADVDNEAEFRRQAEEASAFGRATYIDLAGGKRQDYRGPSQCGVLADCGSGSGSAIYYHVTQSNDRFYIDYWWFFRFNNFYRSRPGLSCLNKSARTSGICDEHEGDWEGVTVVTPPDEDSKLDYVVYAAHKGTFRYTGQELQRHGETRPDVYIAAGSHAAYPTACSHSCVQPIALEGLVNLPESNFNGRSDWERDGEDCKPNTPGSCLLSLPRTDHDPQAWTVWPGQWGAGCGDVCHGNPGAASPLSPGLQTRYQTPSCSTQTGVFACDGLALSCSDWLGPLVAVVACDPKTLAEGLRDPNATRPGLVTVTVRGEETNRESTPGVVQTLGNPLSPGEAVTVTGGSAGTQLLVRAQQGRFIVEARFDNLGPGKDRRAVVTIGKAAKGSEGPTILLGGRRPVERRIIEVQQPPRGSRP
jgi:hypothetical protein